MITWASKAYGWEGALLRLNTDRNNILLSRNQRSAADKAHAKIVAQLADKKLMNMRERLTKSAQAGDAFQQARIQQQMRDYLGEDKETGLYEQA